jgi:hypothetical protein
MVSHGCPRALDYPPRAHCRESAEGFTATGQYHQPAKPLEDQPAKPLEDQPAKPLEDQPAKPLEDQPA